MIPPEKMGAFLKAARVRVVDRHGVIAVRLPTSSSFMTFVKSIIYIGVVLTFAYVVGTALTPSHTVPSGVTIVAATMAIAFAFLLALRRQIANSDGSCDFVFDHREGTISLPVEFGRSERLTIPVQRVTSILPAQEVPRDREFGDFDYAFQQRDFVPLALKIDQPVRDTGTRGEVFYSVIVNWVDDDGNEHVAPIVRWSELGRANALACWLSGMCGLIRVGPSLDRAGDC